MEEIKLPRIINTEWVEKNEKKLLNKSNLLLLNFIDTISIDSAGIALIHLLENKKEIIEIENIRKEILKLIQNRRAEQESNNKKLNQSFLEKIGTNIYARFELVKEAISVFVEMIYWGTIGSIKKRDFRKGVVGEQMFSLGYGAIPITITLTFLIGIALAMQSAIQLKAFGADIFLITLVVKGMIQELGPLMAAIILAGRTGSATTAEIATMMVQEEVDALKTMGLNEIQFIVVPKFWALSLTMPLVTTLAIMSGIFGGMLVAWSYIGMSPNIIMAEFIKNIEVKVFIVSIFKSLVFAWLIIWIGAYYGFRVSGGAEEVGKETTRSVVSAIFVIVMADALFSFVY